MLAFAVFVAGLLFSTGLRKSVITRILSKIFIGILLSALNVAPINKIHYGKAEAKTLKSMPTHDDDKEDDDDRNPD